MATTFGIVIDTLAGSLMWIVLAGLLAAAVWHDVRFARIPNVISGAGIVLGFAFAALGSGIGMHALYGLALGFAVMLPLYLVRATGAGDVKLVAMVGAFVGPRDVLGVLLLTFVVGAIIAIVHALRTGALHRLAHNVATIVYAAAGRCAGAPAPQLGAASIGKLPYAVPIAFGTLFFFAWKHTS